LGPELIEIQEKAEFALQYAPGVHDSAVNHVYSHLNGILVALTTQSARSEQDYVAHRDEVIEAIRSHREEIRLVWPAFISSAVEDRRFLSDEGIRNEYQKVLEEMRMSANATLEQIRAESERILVEAKQVAADIEQRARRTAAHISVEDAQRQFKEAQEGLKLSVRNWSWISGFLILLFLALAAYFEKTYLPASETGPAIYYTAVRISALTALGAIVAFSLRVLRAHMHMRQHNLHRQHVANSMASFVESAITPEQRDMILAQLVGAVAAFGNSGLISDQNDAIAPATLAIESINRTISPAQRQN
jgi:hypothetical protein